jgi:hypothetical protein
MTFARESYDTIKKAQMPPNRKRAKGGGRKPIGPRAKASNFSTRIRADTRGALEAEARLAGLSVSRMAEQLLEIGIATRRERARESPTSSLLDLIGKLADNCKLVGATGRVFEWHTDPFVKEALRSAISLLLQELNPQGESSIKEHFPDAEGGVHRLYREILSSPDAWAKHAFLRLWEDLCSIPSKSPSEYSAVLGPDYSLSDVELKGSQYSYDLDRARRALGFKERKL